MSGIIGKQDQPLVVRLAHAVDQLYATLGDFVESRTVAVEGTEARGRIDAALVALREVQQDLERFVSPGWR